MIRLANSSDIEKIQTLVQCFEFEPITIDDYNYLVIVAEEKELVGYLEILITDIAEVIYVFVDENYRGNKIAEEMFEYASKVIDKSTYLEVRESNVSAKNLYKRLGFEKIAERKNYYSNPVENAEIYFKAGGKDEC